MKKSYFVNNSEEISKENRISELKWEVLYFVLMKINGEKNCFRGLEQNSSYHLLDRSGTQSTIHGIDLESGLPFTG